MKNIINESSLSRLWSHNEKYDCAALTAFRRGADCGEGEKYNHKDNQKRNKSLKAKLMSKDYDITSLKGKYPEGGRTGMETSFFVVNSKEDSNFFKVIANFGEHFDQDSVLLIPKGAINNTAKAYLYGTNHCENNDLGYHKKHTFERGKLGRTSPIYTSYVGKRPFIFEEVGKVCTPPASGMGLWMMHIVSEMGWEDLKL